MMEQSQENKMDADESQREIAAEVAEVASVGRMLREARESMGLSVDDVVNKIKLAPRQIEALESDDFTALPEIAFVRGFVRSYARLLQLDEQPLLDALPGAKVVQVKVDPLHVEAPFPTERTARQQNINLLIAALLIALLIAGFALWQSNSPQPVAVEKAQETGLVATPLPLPEQVEILDASAVPESAVVSVAQEAASPVTADAAVPASTLRLVFDKESWVEIKERSGKLLSSQVNQPGTELRIEGQAPFSLVIGHAAAVHLFYREKPVDLMSYINASSDVARLTLE